MVMDLFRLFLEGEVLHHEVIDSVMRSTFVIEWNGDTVYNIADKKPEYIGGADLFATNISATLEYPKLARKKREQGVVFVLFTVDEKGNVSNARVVKGFNDLCDAEAVRTIKWLNHWTPAKHHDRNVKARMIQPVRFALTDEELGGDANYAGPIILGIVRALVR